MIYIVNFEKKVKGKIYFVLSIFVLVLFLLSIRIFYIKEVHGEEYEIKAKTQQVNRYDKIITPNRGTVVDRNKQALSVSVTVFNIVLDPIVLVQNSSEEQEKTLKVLSETLELNIDELRNYISVNPETGKLNKNTHWLYLKKMVDRETKEKLEAQNIKGVFYEKDSKRSYPLNELASHVLGFARGDVKWGLEDEYNDYMNGTEGRSFITYDGTDSAVTKEIPAKDGNTVVTTLDYTIQQYAEQAVQQAVDEYTPENASAIVMDPYTGEIVAMASSPNYNPNDPTNPLSLSNEEFKSTWENMPDDDKYKYLNNTWKNFNVSSTFEPGSIFKPLVVAAALEENLINTNTTFYCSGKKTVYDTVINCWYRSGHGKETLEDVLANSCNVGMMEIAEKMGSELFYKYQLNYGFGSLTGIDLPGEVSAKNLMYTADRIGPVELATMSFGQSFNCTPIQVLTAFASVINGGNLMRPYVVSQVVDSNGNTVKENKPEIVRKVISQNTSDIIRNYLKATVDRGTGKKAKIEGYSIGGKTGTAEQGVRDKKNYTLSYIAYLPVENPQYISIVIIHKPSNYIDGVTTPAPIMKSLLEKIIKYKAIEPTDTSLEGSENSENASKKVKVDNYINTNLSDALISLDMLGLKYEIAGTGNTISNQVPSADTEVEEGTKILLYVTKGEGDKGNIQVPDVTGLSYEEAVEKISNEGLSAVINGDETGNVVSQEPKAGVFVESDAEVTITIKNENTN